MMPIVLAYSGGKKSYNGQTTANPIHPGAYLLINHYPIWLPINQPP